MRCCELRRVAAIVVTIVTALAAAGCSQDRGPFAHEPGRAPALVRPVADGGGIVVLGVDGLPEPVERALQDAMIEALARHDIPATTSGGNLRSRYLQGSATAEPRPGGAVRLELFWDLTDRQGRPIGSQPLVREVPRARWERGDPVLIKSLAAEAAPAIAALIQEPAPADADRARRVTLHVWPVAGLPEVEALALRRAMEAALKRRDHVVANELGERMLVIAGSVAFGKPDNGRRRIEVVWTVLDGAGRELGRLAQDNMIPAGDEPPSLAGNTHDIAEAAAGGVTELLQRLPPSATAGAG